LGIIGKEKCLFQMIDHLKGVNPWLTLKLFISPNLLKTSLEERCVIFATYFFIIFFNRVSGPPTRPPISGDSPVGKQAKGGEHSPRRGARPPNSLKHFPPT